MAATKEKQKREISRKAFTSSNTYPELYTRLVEIAALVGWCLFLGYI